MEELATTPEIVKTLVANHDRFLRFLMARVGSRDRAEEILQAAFVKSVERADAIREHESAVAWFYRLLRNAIIDDFRRRDASRRAIDGLAAETDGQVAEPELEQLVCACVNGLVETLKPEYAEIVRAVDLGGQAVPEVAAKLAISPNNAAVRLHRARQALRRQLERTCGTCTEHGCLDCHCQRP